MAASKTSTTIQSLQVGNEILELVASYDKPLKFNEIYEKNKNHQEQLVQVSEYADSNRDALQG